MADYAATLKPSARLEYKITDLNQIYARNRTLNVDKLGRRVALLDTRTHESYAQATNFIKTVEQRQGSKIARLQEIAYRMG